MNDNMFIGMVYIPPRDSRFYTNDEVDLFNAEVSEMCISHNYVLLMGDFNARTYDKQDFIEAENYFRELFDFDVNSDYFNASSKLDGSKFSKNRVSQDTIVNNEGNLLLDMCKSNNFILNRRYDSDIKCTCNDDPWAVSNWLLYRFL